MSRKQDVVDWRHRHDTVQQDFTNFKVQNLQYQKELTALKRMLAKIHPSALEQWQLTTSVGHVVAAPPQRIVPRDVPTTIKKKKKRTPSPPLRPNTLLQQPTTHQQPTVEVRRVLQNLQQAAASRSSSVPPPKGGVHVAPPRPQLVQAWADRSQTEEELLPPLPSMQHLAWGCDSTLAAVPSEGLARTVVMMRDKLHDAEVVISSLREELMRSRDAVAKVSAVAEEAGRERNHVLMERDVLSQMLETRNTAYQTLVYERDAMAEQHLRTGKDLGHAHDLRRAHELESKRLELHMTETQRSLLDEAKYKTAALTAANVRVATAESALRGMRDANEAMLNEVKTLNQQLVAERTTVVTLMRNVQGTLGVQDASEVLRHQLDAARDDVRVLTAGRLELMSHHVEMRGNDERLVREECKRRMEELEISSCNWERVAQVQWKELEQLSKQHGAMKAQLDGTRYQRDALEMDLDTTRKAFELTQQKLRVLCPNADEVCDVETQELRTALAWIHRRRRGETHPEESHALAQTLERTKKTVALLNERLADVQRSKEVTRAQVEALQQREHRSEADRVRRVHELETQVVSLRQQLGHVVPDNDTSVLELGHGEVMFEAYLGRMDIAVAHRWATDHPQFVVTVDFLVHETSVTDVAFGWTPTFDAYFAYRVDTDDTLMYYLCTQKLRLTLLKVDGSGTTPVGSAEIELDSLVDLPRRRGLQGVAQIRSLATPHDVVCGLEYQLTLRGDFTPGFLALRDLMGDLQAVPDDSLVATAVRALRPVVALQVHVHSAVLGHHTGAWPSLTAHYSYHTLLDVMCPSSGAPSSVVVFDSRQTIAFPQHITAETLRGLCFAPLRIILWSADRVDVPWGVVVITTSELLHSPSLSYRAPIVAATGEGPPLGELHVSLEWVPPPFGAMATTTVVPSMPARTEQHTADTSATTTSLDEDFSMIELA